ncbi:MAG: transglutaminase domain-containing protein, partial [Acutalibacteraceae bacterium]
MNIRHIKKSAALLLSFLILLSCTLTGAYAQESITVPESAIYSQQYPDAYKAIVMGIENMQTEINLANANVPNKSIDGQALISYIYQEVLDENPQLFYVDISQGYSYSVNYKNVTKLHLSYTTDNAAIDEMKREFESLSQKYLSLISDEMTDFEKALVIHDAIVLNCEYDETLGKAENAFNAYGVFSNGVAVCQGYSYAYKYLLERLGIECHIVSSISMKHAWNIVKIDNDYYHVDVTWDDPVHDKLGRVEHTYFLLSDEEIQSGNKPHTGYGSSHPATNDRFDSYFWKNVSSAFNYSNGDWYYTDTYGNIYKGTTENMQETVLLTVTDKWYVGSSGRYYTDKFTKTALHNGYLYYNTPDYVKRISLQNSQEVQIVYTNTDNSAHLFAITKKLDDVMYTSLLSDYNGYDNVIILYDLSKEEPQPSVEATSEPTSTPDEPTTAVPEATPEEPTTTAPVTEPTEPTTTAPVTEPTEPTTTAPVTEPTEPATTAPVTKPTEPTTTAPVTEPTEPTTTAPVTEPTEPTTTAPVTEPTEPTTTAPVTEPTEPTTTAPVTEPTEPTTTAPVTEPTEPTTTAPVTEPTEP